MEENPTNPSDSSPASDDLHNTKKVSSKKSFKFKLWNAPTLVALTLVVMIIVVLIALVDVHVNQPQNKQSEAATDCTPNALLVNPCRILLGAAVGGDPNAPGTGKIAAFNFLETQLGRKLDLFHDYHSPGSIPMNSDETYFANRANTFDYINYKPAGTWGAADGSNATVNANIKKAADSVKANGHKVFITIWHEPENDVSAFDNGTNEASVCGSNQYFKALKGGAGTPAQYRAMWANVQQIFRNEGANNVVWVMNYMNYRPWECLVPMLWPAYTPATRVSNTEVDWVTFEAYAGGSDDWKTKISDMYNVLLKDTDANHDFTSHPWGLGEIGDCNDTAATATQKYQGFKSILDNNTFPRLKMIMFFDSAEGPGGTSGCLVDKGSDELAAVKSFANDPVFKSTTVTPAPPTPTRTPQTSPQVTHPTPTPVPASGSTTLIPVADTYVYLSKPTVNFGSAPALWATDGYYRTYLRFKTIGVVPSGSTVKSAKLKVYVRRQDITTGGFRIHPESYNWEESTLTWNNQPTWNSTILVTSATPQANTWITITLPVSAINFSGNTNLGVTYSDKSSNTSFSSREDTTYQPKLIIAW